MHVHMMEVCVFDKVLRLGIISLSGSPPCIVHTAIRDLNIVDGAGEISVVLLFEVDGGLRLISRGVSS